MKKLIFLLLPALMPLNGAALELLLEENRGESGTIGYVDIDRVFKEYSGTTGARDEFIAEIKKKEETLNAKKTPIFTLRAEIAKLRQERAFALTLPSLLETRRSVAEAAAATEAAAAAQTAQAAQAAAAAEAAAAAQIVQTSTDTLPVSTEGAKISAEIPQESTAAPKALPSAGAQPAPAALPPAVTLPPAEAPPAAAALLPPAVQPPAVTLPPGMSSLPGMAGLTQGAAPSGIDMPGIADVPVAHFKFSISTSVPEIDAALTKKEAELAGKEEALRVFQRQTERELLEYESRKSEILLGRIYVALKELAVKEAVSVIIDKRNILFGQKAVDLTGKLMKKLEENEL